MSKKKNLTAEEINEFVANSDSDESDWGDIGEVDQKDFLSQLHEPSKPKKVFESTNEPIIFPDISNTPTANEVKIKPKTIVNKHCDTYTVKPTKIRVKNAALKENEWIIRRQDRRVLHASQASDTKVVKSISDSEWILVGVITHNVTKKSKNDKVFCYWILNDLEILDKSVKLFLFGSIYQDHWKVSEGSVVAILMPKLMDSDAYKEAAFTVDNTQQIIVLGRSVDMGKCEAKRKSGESCNNVVKKSECTFCSYHVQTSYFNATRRPGFYDEGKDTFNARKRSANSNNMNRTKCSKVAVDTGVKVNNSITMDALNKCGITKLANTWGLVDSYDCKKLQKLTDESEKTIKQSKAANIEKSDKMISLLKKPSAGSKNMIQSIVQKTQNAIAVKSGEKSKRTVTMAELKAKVEQANSNRTSNNLHLNSTSNNNTSTVIKLGAVSESDKLAARKNYRELMNKQRLISMVNSQGGVLAMEEAKKKQNIERVMNLVKNQRSLTSDQNTPPTSKKKQLSAEMLELLKKGSSNLHLVDADKQIEQEKFFDKMEIIEKMENKLIEMHEEKCIVFFCKQCKDRFFKRPAICVAEHHTITSSEGKKRYFECMGCQYRLASFETYPVRGCVKCGSNSFKKVGKVKEQIVPLEKPLVDGGNKRWINN